MIDPATMSAMMPMLAGTLGQMGASMSPEGSFGHALGNAVSQFTEKQQMTQWIQKMLSGTLGGQALSGIMKSSDAALGLPNPGETTATMRNGVPVPRVDTSGTSADPVGSGISMQPPPAAAPAIPGAQQGMPDWMKFMQAYTLGGRLTGLGGR